MTLSLLFWILMLLWLIFGVFQAWPKEGARVSFASVGGSLFAFLLFLILGWAQFGTPIQG